MKTLQEKKTTVLYELKKIFYFVNIHVNVLTIILANQTQQHIKRMIHHDKVGGMPRMQGWFHMQPSINATYHINRTKGGNT